MATRFDDFAGTGELSASWIADILDATVLRSNGAAVSGGGAGSFAQAYWDPSDQCDADQASAIVVRGGHNGANTAYGVTVRNTGTTGSTLAHYHMYRETATNLRLDRRTAGPTFVEIATRTVTQVDDEELELRVVGDQLTIWHNGVQQGAAITDTVITSGQPGIQVREPHTIESWTGDGFAAVGSLAALLLQYYQ